MKGNEMIACIHGLMWQTCALCHEKTEQEIEQDLNYQREEQTQKLIYDYQEVAQSTIEGDADLAYDMDDGM